MEAKTTRCCSIQAAEVVCSKAISAAKAQKTSQAVMLQEEHGKYLQNLEEQAFREESRSHHEVLSSCQAVLCHSPQPLRGALAALYHLLLGQAPPSPPLVLPPRTPSAEEQPSTAAPPMPMPKQSPRQKGSILCQSQQGTCPWAESPQQLCWGDLPAPRSKRPHPGSSCQSLAMLRPSSGTLT